MRSPPSSRTPAAAPRAARCFIVCLPSKVAYQYLEVNEVKWYTQAVQSITTADAASTEVQTLPGQRRLPVQAIAAAQSSAIAPPK
jgi:hypothetical protein